MLILKFSNFCSNYVRKKLGNETSRRRSPKLFNYTAELGESQVAVNEELIYSNHSKKEKKNSNYNNEFFAQNVLFYFYLSN